MSPLKSLAFAGALFATSAAAAPTWAATAIAGGGSTLFAPVWEQIVLCYDADAQTFYQKGIPVTNPNPSPPRPASCAPPTRTGTLIPYDATGSGAGQAGLFGDTAVIRDAKGNVLFGSLDTQGTQKVFASVQYGLSDNSLLQADLVTYDKGTASSETLNFNGDSGTFSSPATYQNLTFSDDAAPSATNLRIPQPQFGALVQFPIAIVPIALAYNPTFNNGASTFNVQNGDANGGLKLTAQAYCKIFTGEIINWNDAYLTSLNNSVSLTGGASVPITLAGRSDASGETSIFTRHLAAVCSVSGNLDAGVTNPYSAGVLTLPTSVQSLYTLAPSSSAVANVIHGVSGAIGYIGSAYVLPAVTNTMAVSFSLPVAALKNNAGNYEEPTGATALASFGTVLPPQSSSLGAYNKSITINDRRDPTQWVQSTAASAPLANPAASIASAYPIVGTTNFLGYTCYKAAASATAIDGFVTFVNGATGKTVLSASGLSQLPANWTKAILNTFLESTGDAKALNLFLAPAGAGSSNTMCSASGVTGG